MSKYPFVKRGLSGTPRSREVVGESAFGEAVAIEGSPFASRLQPEKPTRRKPKAKRPDVANTPMKGARVLPLSAIPVGGRFRAAGGTVWESLGAAKGRPGLIRAALVSGDWGKYRKPGQVAVFAASGAVGVA